MTWAALLQEKVTGAMLLDGTTIIAGVYLAERRRSPLGDGAPEAEVKAVAEAEVY